MGDSGDTLESPFPFEVEAVVNGQSVKSNTIRGMEDIEALRQAEVEALGQAAKYRALAEAATKQVARTSGPVI